jgi:hypothetical protein
MNEHDARIRSGDRSFGGKERQSALRPAQPPASVPPSLSLCSFARGTVFRPLETHRPGVRRAARISEGAFIKEERGMKSNSGDSGSNRGDHRPSSEPAGNARCRGGETKNCWQLASPGTKAVDCGFAGNRRPAGFRYHEHASAGLDWLVRHQSRRTR